MKGKCKAKESGKLDIVYASIDMVKDKIYDYEVISVNDTPTIWQVTDGKVLLDLYERDFEGLFTAIN